VATSRDGRTGHPDLHHVDGLPGGTVDARIAFDEATAAVAKVDLALLRRKLREPDHGEPWPADLIDFCFREYRRYLCLHMMFPNASLSPTRAMDEIWHRHILDTRTYAVDCDRLFGGYFHHDPYFGLRSEQEREPLRLAHDELATLYERVYGDPLLDVDDVSWPAS
jgi:hypothetical protein